MLNISQGFFFLSFSSYHSPYYEALLRDSSFLHFSYSKTFSAFRRKKKDGAGGTHKQTLSFGLITDAGNWDTDFDQLTGYSWNPDLFTTGPIPAIRCGLNFNNVVLFNGQQKFSWSFICVQHLHIILTASPIENLKCMNKHIFFYCLLLFFHQNYSPDVTSFISVVFLYPLLYLLHS